MKDEDWMDAKTEKPLKCVIIKVRKIVEENIPIAIFNEGETTAIDNAIKLLKKKNKENIFKEPKTRWEYEIPSLSIIVE
jgi:hypothetical protein